MEEYVVLTEHETEGFIRVNKILCESTKNLDIALKMHENFKNVIAVISKQDIDECEDIYHLHRSKLRKADISVSHEEPPPEQNDSNDKDITGIYSIKQLTYSIHKKDGEKILKASYNFKSEKGWVWSSKYLMFDRTGYPRQKAVEWLNERIENEMDVKDREVTTDWVHSISSQFEKPNKIRVGMNDQGYPYILEEIWE